MLKALTLFPPYLAIMTVLLVILPTVICLSMRISLYKHLQNLERKTKRLINNNSEGIQPKFINLLEIRFSNISQQVENVNTLALIDGVYNNETFTSFGINIRCEEGEYITKIVPNLLLAFGLLGTFLGITTNLYSISEIINQGGGDITDLTSQLQRPLQSMGIAFITSLIALICSSLLTVNNIKHNVNLEKNSLLTNLEDYIDNIYRPKIRGYSRLDEAVNRMVDKQNEFLLRFHENVGQVLEQTFKKAADRIADENEKSQTLVSQLYENLFDACSAINNGAISFKDSMINLQNHLETLRIMMPVLTQNMQSFEKSVNIMLSASNQIEASKFSQSLTTTITNLADIEFKFTKTTELLANSATELIDNNKKATQLAQDIYNQFHLSSGSLENSALVFASSATSIKESKFNEHLDNTTNKIVTIQEQFSQTINQLAQVIKPINTNIELLENYTHKMKNLTGSIDQVVMNTDSINVRYLETTNTSKNILVELEKLSSNHQNTSGKLTDNLNKIIEDLQNKMKFLTNYEKEYLGLNQKLILQLQELSEFIIGKEKAINDRW